jgi:hypothetical protein
MVKSKYIFLVFFLFSFFTANSQINLNFERDCLNKNSVILSHMFIESLGENTVKKILDNNIRMVILLNVDSLGLVSDCEKIICKQNLPISLTQNILNLLTKSKKPFFICYELPRGKNDEEAYKIISKGLFEDKKAILINVAFPGDLMTLYDYEKKEENKRGKSLTKYEYLQRRIKVFEK